jgi:cytochrome c5
LLVPKLNQGHPQLLHFLVSPNFGVMQTTFANQNSDGSFEPARIQRRSIAGSKQKRWLDVTPAVSIFNRVKTCASASRSRLQTAVWLLVCAAFVGLAPNARSQETNTNSVASKNAPQVKAAPANPAPEKTRPAAHQLTGAELYSMHCNRCHPERYPTERTAAQWKTILLHMRVRANLPAEHARIILKYLQENSGR